MRGLLILVIGFALTLPARAQRPFALGQGNQAVALPGGNQVGIGRPVGANNGFPGGAQSADFDSLMDLIISTVQPDTWAEAGGGAAEIRPFPTGVWIDATGVLHQPVEVKLTSLDVVPAAPTKGEVGDDDPRQPATLRVVSLTRLERELARRMTAKLDLDESMLTLAGLQRAQYVFVYPDSGEVALAGPAGDWRVDATGRIVAADTGQAIVRLDDLLELWRRERAAAGKPYGCAITPRQEGLAATQQFIADHQGQAIAAGGRDKYVQQLQQALGRQDIEVFSLESNTHVAQVLVEADYHMKRIGIGLEPGVAGVDSYLTSLVREQGASPASSVLRWWFATNYQGVAHNQASTAWELCGQGVCVLSENELLTTRGERVHTGQSDAPTQQFAHQFTQHFAALAARYPVYSELRNVFDLGVVVALLEAYDLPATAGWQPDLLISSDRLPLPQYRVPREVDTIANHISPERGRFIAVVSGGVWVDAAEVVKSSDTNATPTRDLDYVRREVPPNLGGERWWWDVER